MVCLVATGATGPDLDEAIAAVRSQLSFYASTPAYRPVLEPHGWDGIQPSLNRLSKEGRWDDMRETVPIEAIAGSATSSTAFCLPRSWRRAR